MSYHYFSRTWSDSNTYHGLLLGGLANGESEGQRRLETLLGYSENVTHDEWSPDAQRPVFRQWIAASSRLKKAITAIGKHIKKFTKKDVGKPEGDAAPLFARMFKFGTGSGASSERICEITDWIYDSIRGEEGLQYSISGQIYIPESAEYERKKKKKKPVRWQLHLPGRCVQEDGKPLSKKSGGGNPLQFHALESPPF